MNSYINNLFTLALAMGFIFLTCKDQEAEKKIDANLRMQINNLQQTSRLDQTISIVFKTNETLTDLHKSVLKKQNINITANIGNIYTATLPANELYNLAKMKFVESIQGSRQLKIHPVDSLKRLDNTK